MGHFSHGKMILICARASREMFQPKWSEYCRLFGANLRGKGGCTRLMYSNILSPDHSSIPQSSKSCLVPRIHNVVFIPLEPPRNFPRTAPIVLLFSSLFGSVSIFQSLSLPKSRKSPPGIWTFCRSLSSGPASSKRILIFGSSASLAAIKQPEVPPLLLLPTIPTGRGTGAEAAERAQHTMATHKNDRKTILTRR